MKRQRVEYLVDHFVDDNGDTRFFVIAAVSEVLPTTLDEIYPDEEWDEDEMYVSTDVVRYTEFDSDIVDTVVKSLRLGWAICNPVDKFDETVGKQIALGRALKNSEAALYSTHLGYINTKVVKAFLEQEAEFFKENPANRIAGYKRKK